MDVLIPCHICFLTVAIVLRHLASHILGLGASDFVQLIAADGGLEIAAYGIRHIAARIVYDILGIVCDSTIFCGIGDIKCSLQLRGLIGAIGDRLFGRIQVVLQLIHFRAVSQLLSRCIGYIIGSIGIGTIGHPCLKAAFLLGHSGIGGFSFADDRGDFIALLCHFGFASIRLYVAHDGIDALLEGRAFSLSTRNGIRDAFVVQHAGIIAHLVGQLRIRFVGDVLRFVRNVAGHGRGLVSADGIFLISIDLVGLLASDVDVLIPSDSMIFRTLDMGIKSAVEVLRRLSCHGGSQLAAYGIRHIAGGVVHDILCIVCDSTILSGVLDISAGIVLNIHCIVFNGALFSDIGDILRSLLRLRGRACRIRDFCHGRILGIDLKIHILPILVLNLEAILCRSDFRIGLVAVLVSRRAIDAFCGLARIGAISLRIFGFGLDTICCHIRAGFCPVSRVALLRIGFAALFRMGELALRGHTALFHLSVMSDTVCGNRSRAIMNRTIRVRLLVFHGNLAYIELAIDRQIFLYGDIFLKFCFAFCGQCAIERGLFIDTERAIDLSILEAGFTSHIERAIHRCTFQRRSPIGHGQTFIHLYGFLECRLSSGDERTIDFRILKAGFTSHIERAIHIRLFELGIACDRERLIHGHVALELRSIFHFQRACVHSARRGDIASASIHAFACQLAIRSHIAFRLHVAKVIDSHIAFDRSFVCSVIAFDSGGALIGRSNGVRIGLNVICIRLDIALELDILLFEFSDILTVFSDFPFQLRIFSGTRCFFCRQIFIGLIQLFASDCIGGALI